MDQHPSRQIPDDELVEIADRPQLWISRDGYARTSRAGLVRAANIIDRGRSPYPLVKPRRCQGRTRADVAPVEPPGDCSGEAAGLSRHVCEGSVSFCLSHEQAAAIRRLAAASQGEHNFAQSTALSVEQIRHVLAQEACHGST